MLFYGLLALATLLGFFGLGILSMALLALTWALTRTPLTDSFPNDHRCWIKKTTQAGIIAHLTLICILIAKVVLVVNSNGEGWLSALVAHWLLDHIGEALISVWLTYRLIKGGANLQQKNPPEHSRTPLPSDEMHGYDNRGNP